MTDFNPRSHKGSDDVYDLEEDEYTISIHAPTRGATLNLNRHIIVVLISIHAPTRGSDSIG